MSRDLVVDRFIKYLVEELYVPMDMIDTDVPLSEFDPSYKDDDQVVDIIVNVKDKDDYLVPVMIINCLDEDIELEGEVLSKQLEILEEIDGVTLSGRAVLTNGNEIYYGDWTESDFESEQEADMPNYETMVKEFEQTEQLASQINNDHDHDHQ